MIEVPLVGARGAGQVTLVDPLDAWVLDHRWFLSPRGYVHASRDGHPLHRFILGLERGDPLQGDHINGDRLDNRRTNLRIVTAAQNSQNRRSVRGSASPYRGVTWRSDPRMRAGGYWRARVVVENGSREVHVGGFKTQEEARDAVIAARRELQPYANEERDRLVA